MIFIHEVWDIIWMEKWLRKRNLLKNSVKSTKLIKIVNSYHSYKMTSASEEKKTSRIVLQSKRRILAYEAIVCESESEWNSCFINRCSEISWKQEVFEITKRQTKPTEFSEISAGQPLYSVQMDVCVYNRYKIDNYQYILGVIDVYSRFVVCRALTNLRIPTLIEALRLYFRRIFQSSWFQSCCLS